MVGLPLRGGAFARALRFGHRLVVLAGGWFLAAPDGQGRGDRALAGFEEPAEAVREALPGRHGRDGCRRDDLAVRPEVTVPAIALLDQRVDGKGRQAVQLAHDDRLQAAPGVGGVGVGASGGSSMTSSMIPSSCWSWALMRIASAAVAASSVVRHRMLAQPSGLITE